ncbi:hypothetical protein EAH79_11780 [Sphingomonas koreensis]|nr:hypothetical protein EAH79_11780 [Sphingomonas koreensis]
MTDAPVSLRALNEMTDSELFSLRAELHGELRRRGLAVTVGQVAELLAIAYFNSTPGCPNLLEAGVGTTNVDALSRRGERYAIKGILVAKKTGQIYPDPLDADRQLFEHLLIVKLKPDWTLEAIWRFDRKTFVECRSWDRRMNAWYVGLAAKTLARAECLRPPGEAAR